MSTPRRAIQAWESQGFTGTIANLVILAAALTGIGLAVLSATSRTVALPVAASALSRPARRAAAVVMVILRMIFQPGPNEFVDLQAASSSRWSAPADRRTAAGGRWRRRWRLRRVRGQPHRGGAQRRRSHRAAAASERRRRSETATSRRSPPLLRLPPDHGSALRGAGAIG